MEVKMGLKIEGIIVLIVSLALIIFGIAKLIMTNEIYWLSFVLLPMFWLAIVAIYFFTKNK